MPRKYGLYVVRPEDIGDKEKYYLITPTWALLYTNRKPPEKNREVTNITMLPEIAMTWLKGTIDQIRLEYLRDNEEAILERGKAFTERFEAELKAEKEKLEQKG